MQYLLDAVSVNHPYGLKHLTLTIPNRPDAGFAAKEIVTAFRRMRQRTLWKRYVKGGMFVIEATGEPGNWHVHIHAVILAQFVPFEKLHALWMDCSSGRGLYIQRIPRHAIVTYLTKYISKASVPEDHAALLGEELGQFRLFQPFGCFHGLAPMPPLPPYVCPHCGSDCWLPDTLIDLSFVRMRRTGKRCALSRH